MKNGLRTDLILGQNLTMTPQLQQAIKLLQLNQLELTEHIEQTILQNPFLERADNGEVQVEYDENEEYGTNDEMNFAEDAGRDLGTMMDHLDASTENLYDDPVEYSQQLAQNLKSHNGSFDVDEDFDPISNYTREDSFLQKLDAQIALSFKESQDQFIAHRICEFLEPSGWLNSEYGKLASQLSVPLAHIDAIVNRLQQCEPAGLFARNLQECLKIQLVDKKLWNNIIAVIVNNLDLLANPNSHNKLAKMAHIKPEQLMKYMGDIRSCNPKPGAGLDIQFMGNIEPDIFLMRNQKNEWVVELNDSTTPRIGLNDDLLLLFANPKTTRHDKSFASEKYNEAKWLLRSIEQRNLTIIKVAREIVKKQKAFFDFGVTHLRPLVLREVADAIQMHESTVSRVTTNKYISTPRGMFEMKYFFTSALQTASGASVVSAEAVRYRIRKMIDAENPNEILSDDTIVNNLIAEGIDIARRTVAKYRESMHIPSSVQRRRLKKSYKNASPVMRGANP